MPIAAAVRAMRSAISPRLAIRREVIGVTAVEGPEPAEWLVMLAD
jgi:hypothetical protein